MLDREFPTVTHQENRVVWELLFIRTLSKQSMVLIHQGGGV